MGTGSVELKGGSAEQVPVGGPKLQGVQFAEAGRCERPGRRHTGAISGNDHFLNGCRRRTRGENSGETGVYPLITGTGACKESLPVYAACSRQHAA
jgi:hypothetical protein